MAVEKKWTVCSRFGGKVRKVCQYTDKARAEAHAKSNGENWFVKLCDVNPERIIELRGRNRSCVGYRKIGLPQH